TSILQGSISDLPTSLGGPAAHHTQRPRIAPIGDPWSPSREGPRENRGRRTMHWSGRRGPLDESRPFRYDASDDDESTISAPPLSFAVRRQNDANTH
ncbi:MAG: hypothetical protein GY847_35015, partial [Proteobacteria bacterium]|nr:hypothetical protein [Pseudomonadota bacterium]